MAIKSGRVGVAREQVDIYGRLIPTDFLIAKLREILDTNQAEINALSLARQELAELGLDEPIIQKPIPVIEEPLNVEVNDGTEVKQVRSKKRSS